MIVSICKPLCHKVGMKNTQMGATQTAKKTPKSPARGLTYIQTYKQTYNGPLLT